MFDTAYDTTYDTTYGELRSIKIDVSIHQKHLHFTSLNHYETQIHMLCDIILRLIFSHII